MPMTFMTFFIESYCGINFSEDITQYHAIIVLNPFLMWFGLLLQRLNTPTKFCFSSLML